MDMACPMVLVEAVDQLLNRAAGIVAMEEIKVDIVGLCWPRYALPYPSQVVSRMPWAM